MWFRHAVIYPNEVLVDCESNRRVRVSISIRTMHDLRWIREHPEEFDRGLVRRGLPARAEEILALDRAWRAAETSAQEAQARRNRIAREIGAAKKRGEDVERLLRQSLADKDFETAAAGEAAALRASIDGLLAELPNLPGEDVPDGPDETANEVLRHHGEPPAFRLRLPSRTRRSASASA